ncbi:MAG: sulfite exporter TauE/SafE family protein [Bacteroidetes bacterium]|nr:sulfite exporter TauE/SafE family protein [Bacteroidota bacterium]
MWQTALAGFSLGLLGSLHCVGMCGPLALSLPVRHLSRGRQVIAILLYNTGRVITYTILGALFGWAGRGLSLAGFQQWLSIVLGVTILLSMTVRFRTGRVPVWIKPFYRWVERCTGSAFRLLTRSSSLSVYLLPGLLNGLLPCGMIYLGIAAAISMRDAVTASVWMGGFGMGTLPAMLLLGVFGLRISLPVRQQLRRAMPVLAMLMAVALILRGLNLGIPYLSPAMDSGGVLSCHK